MAMTFVFFSFSYSVGTLHYKKTEATLMLQQVFDFQSNKKETLSYTG